MIAYHLKWASFYLLNQSFCSSRLVDTFGRILIGEPGLVRRYECSSGRRRPDSSPTDEQPDDDDDDDDQCSICLCKIEEGDIIRELRCEHLFHGVCLDSWIWYGRVTCPLCRNNLSRPWLTSESSREVLFFPDFCSVGSSENDRWWLR